MVDSELKCSVSGSFFKFKPEIDLLIDEFRDLGITVIAPDKGWLYIPRHLIKPGDLEFRPLPRERGMSVKQIEDGFLEAVKKSHFLYVANFEGHVGNSMGLEMGFAFGCGVPIFLREPIKSEELNDLWWKEIVDQIPVASPSEVRRLLVEAREEGGS
jgi:hypothetical protein